MNLLKKYDGTTVDAQYSIKINRENKDKFDPKQIDKSIQKTYTIKKLPQFLILHMKRFTKNDFFMEKNITIVNFPLKDLKLGEYIGSEQNETYDLISNIVHEGKNYNDGNYRIQSRLGKTDKWLEIQDLIVKEIMPEQVLVSESYILIY